MEDIELSNKKYGGLCSTCNNAQTCGFLKNIKMQVWQCEEYDNSVAIKKKKAGKQVSQNNRSQVVLNNHNNQIPGKYKGLCINCENRETCNHEKVEGGIWHCEDYL